MLLPKKMKKIAIWGASGHALVVAEIIKKQQQYELTGFVDDINIERKGEQFCGSSIIGGRADLLKLKQLGVKYVIFGFGNCQARLNLSNWLQNNGFLLGTAIHPRAIISEDVTILPGTVITAGAIINPKVTIEENVIINTGATVDHECYIGKGVHICPGVNLAGNVTIKETTWIGIGSTVIQSVTIGKNTVIGAGSVVVNDIPDGVVAYGVPAKIQRRLC